MLIQVLESGLDAEIVLRNADGLDRISIRRKWASDVAAGQGFGRSSLERITFYSPVFGWAHVIRPVPRMTKFAISDSWPLKSASAITVPW